MCNQQLSSRWVREGKFYNLTLSSFTLHWSNLIRWSLFYKDSITLHWYSEELLLQAHSVASGYGKSCWLYTCNVSECTKWYCLSLLSASYFQQAQLILKLKQHHFPGIWKSLTFFPPCVYCLDANHSMSIRASQLISFSFCGSWSYFCNNIVCSKGFVCR